jgi:hypothetical protein
MGRPGNGSNGTAVLAPMTPASQIAARAGRRSLVRPIARQPKTPSTAPIRPSSARCRPMGPAAPGSFGRCPPTPAQIAVARWQPVMGPSPSVTTAGSGRASRVPAARAFRPARRAHWPYWVNRRSAMLAESADAPRGSIPKRVISARRALQALPITRPYFEHDLLARRHRRSPPRRLVGPHPGRPRHRRSRDAGLPEGPLR